MQVDDIFKNALDKVTQPPSERVEVYRYIYREYLVAIVFERTSGNFIGVSKFSQTNPTDYNSAIRESNFEIDSFLDKTPTDWAGWKELFDNCLVWTDYDNCALDEDMLKSALNRYSKTVDKEFRWNL